jgi:hypothetical protein
MDYPCPVCEGYGMCQDVFGTYPCPMCSFEDSRQVIHFHGFSPEEESTLEGVLGKDRASVYRTEYEKVSTYQSDLYRWLTEDDYALAKAMCIKL